MTRRLAAVLPILLIASTSYAFHAEEEVGPLQVEVFAPDWVWQKKHSDSMAGSDINVFVYIANLSNATVEHGVGYRTPNCNAGFILHSRALGDTEFHPIESTRDYNYGAFGKADEVENQHFFGRQGVANYVTVIHPAMPPLPARNEFCFAMPACSAVDSCPPAVYPLGLEAWIQRKPEDSSEDAVDSDKVFITIPIRTIRGAAVSDGLWAKMLPALIGLVWCGVVTLFMRRYMRPGTWRRTFAPETGEAEL